MLHANILPISRKIRVAIAPTAPPVLAHLELTCGISIEGSKSTPRPRINIALKGVVFNTILKKIVSLFVGSVL